MAITRVEGEVGGRKIVFETGRIAKQADGAVMAYYGECVVLGTAVRAEPRPGIDFFPLTVDYREKAYAAGKFPGGFFKREGRPTSKEILTMRMIDRPIRPLFPEGFMDEIQIQTAVLAADPTFDADITGVNASSAALSISSAPFEGPIAAVRVGRVDGKFILNPTYDEMEVSDLDLVLAGHPDGINMIEVGAHEVTEDVMLEAIAFGYEGVKAICDLILELREKAGKPREWTPPAVNEELNRIVREKAYDELRKRRQIVGKKERQIAIRELYEAIANELSPEDAENPPFERTAVMNAIHAVEEEVFVDSFLETGIRTDGRGPTDLRQITCEVGILPRTHGSALFTRGETQSLVVATLGTARDEQIIDGLMEEYSKKFMLHYNFPPFSVGEAKRITGPGRREIGHGALAERSLEAVLPPVEKFPYTIRLVSEITESNGSSSMASVCGGTLALMDAGVPIIRPVAGISIGSIHKGNRRVLITDIIGEEDHFGDMDFKIAGTQRGITGIQLDLKERLITLETIREAFQQAREARLQILRTMLTALKRPREDISPHAPRIITMKINPEKIGAVIGPGGKGIRRIEAATGATIDIEDDGTVMVACVGLENAIRAREMIEQVTEGVKVGKIYTGRVASIKDFGAFIEVAPGQDGLCHISELSDSYVKNVSDVVKVGDEVRVKVILIDDQGRVKLSRKQALLEENANTEGEQEPAATSGNR
ncbi:MAG TPA: polyribonucleotide nucleotidyltransferase [Phycisphaerae bacterium]|jgi:polyribonucleotide nucleotidyltransferase|nr:polyribonucleotide nucleotidyltransferase [Phycisphaerae bacterium]HOB74954.1 polyribonucleotide nucleotidyltransferase [Phycisphaerae bacterium]HOJ55745.1 polyribonucleotide nucleotidyltransferase [Phycisphaerae bacterium]HOL25769.1 polyribonucleotide nucleotidyltransferase [Phycisphaerae bacterium]HPP19538.1 polyribonucleotide nucleotidyltransferase [Phycisphaerae bacterium]